MTNVPRILKIGFDAARRRYAMALPAEAVQFIGGEIFGIDDVVSAGLRRVRRARAMACFAVNTELLRNDRPRIRKLQRPGRVALKTAQDGGIGSERFKSDAVLSGVPRRQGKAARFLIPGETVLEIRVFIRLRDIGDRLNAGPEGPATVGIVRQCLRVMRHTLGPAHDWMTDGARLRTRKALCR